MKHMSLVNKMYRTSTTNSLALKIRQLGVLSFGLLIVYFAFPPLALADDVVKLIQQDLRAMNCQPGSVDGEWGKKTEDAYSNLMKDTQTSAKECGESCTAEILAQVIGMRANGARCEYREPASNAQRSNANKVIQQSIESCAGNVSTVKEQKTQGGFSWAPRVVSYQVDMKYTGDAVSFTMEHKLISETINTKTQKKSKKTVWKKVNGSFRNIKSVNVDKRRGMYAVDLRGGFQTNLPNYVKEHRYSETFYFCDQQVANKVKQAFLDLRKTSP